VKILFLCGSVEQGKDGVGDYARILAAECARLGHETYLLSLNDSWIRGSQRQGTIQRLSSQTFWLERIKAAKVYMDAVRPDLVSLQFVPYSFHPAGLNFALPQILRAIVGRLPVQIMLHEIWTGAQVGAPPKVRVFSFCQRKIIEAMLRKLSCQVVHTSNYVYLQLLANRKINAIHLPLFGNIPIASMDNSGPRAGGVLRIGMFGSIHPEWSPDELFSQLQKLRKPIEISHIGRIGPGESIWSDMVERFKSRIQFRLLGEDSPENISRFLFSVDLGIATTPLSLLGKSGSVAAMLEHGLPVAVTRNDIHFEGVTDESLVTDELLIPLDRKFMERLGRTARRPPKSRLKEVAARFLADIGAAIVTTQARSR
jgi:glycosyltransferase involved in cell wall biosynthesis